MKNNTYKVTIKNWKKYNEKHNGKYKKFFLSNSFFTDSKIVKLKQNEMLLFIYMLCVASELSHDCIDIGVKSIPKSLRINDKLMLDSLRHFEEIQLVSVEKNESLITKLNRIEVNEIEVIKKKELENKSEVSVISKTPPIDRFNLTMSKDAKVLKDFFTENKLGLMSKYIPEILTQFGDVESFDNWYKGVVSSKKFPKDKEFSEQSRYLTGALKGELGLIPEDKRNARS